MGDPADGAFEWPFRSVGDARVREHATRHVTEPASDETIVSWDNTESAVDQQRPDVHEDRGPESDGGCREPGGRHHDHRTMSLRCDSLGKHAAAHCYTRVLRSEERRVGKECRS